MDVRLNDAMLLLSVFLW